MACTIVSLEKRGGAGSAEAAAREKRWLTIETCMHNDGIEKSEYVFMLTPPNSLGWQETAIAEALSRDY